MEKLNASSSEMKNSKDNYINIKDIFCVMDMWFFLCANERDNDV